MRKLYASCFQIIASPILLIFCLISPAHTMTVGGPISVNSVTVTGDVTISSMTVSSMTATNLLQVLGNVVGISGSLNQMQSSATLTALDTTATTYMPVPISV